MAHPREAQRNGIITLALFLSAMAIVLTLIVGNNYFEKVRFEKTSKALAAPNPLLGELRMNETTTLGSYAWTDQANGVVRIPIDRAMELVSQEDLRRREAESGGR